MNANRQFFSGISLSQSIRWLLVMLLLTLGFNAVASNSNRTMDYAWLLFMKINEPPQVDAGIDQEFTWATDSVFLDATVTDDPRDSLAYEWTKLDGPGNVSFTPPDAEDTRATFSASGTYILQISANDGKLMSTSTVIIILSNSAPVVDAGADKQITHPTNSVFLNATASDDPRDALTYSWSKVSGPGTAIFANGSAVDTNVTMYTVGTYTFQLRVSDGQLATTDTVEVRYRPQPVEKIDGIVAVGDSITVGLNDNRSPSGYPPRLEGRLESAKGYAHTIWNEGRSGETSSGGRSRISSIIAAHKYHDVDQYLVMYGTNDANPWAIPVITPAVFKYNMQQIINAIKPAGAQPILAKIPYAKSPRTYKNTYIREFNRVVDELVSTNSIRVTPPDFYYWFEGHQDELSSVDGLHPTPSGYDSMAEIWYFILN